MFLKVSHVSVGPVGPGLIGRWVGCSISEHGEHGVEIGVIDKGPMSVGMPVPLGVGSRTPGRPLGNMRSCVV